jgi:hypothetical protein
MASVDHHDNYIQLRTAPNYEAPYHASINRQYVAVTMVTSNIDSRGRVVRTLLGGPGFNSRTGCHVGGFSWISVVTAANFGTVP